MSVYYNDNNTFVCKQLNNLIETKKLAGGKVDDRSILDVSPDDVKDYDRCHFFAGIGGWELARGMKLNGLLTIQENADQINPDFYCWLMGFPTGWLNYLPLETL